MTETTLVIDGMACSMCEAHVNDAIRRHLPVRSVKSSHRKGQCVIVSESPLDEELLRTTIAKTGYELVSISSRPHQRRSLFSFGR